jgi:hypothetical protein
LLALTVVIIVVVLGVLAGVLVETRKSSERLSSTWQRGANVTAYCAPCFGDPTADASLRALRVTGTNYAAIVPYWYMATRTSTIVAPDEQQSPTDESVLHAMAMARALGMHVVLKPQFDVRDGTFRGEIAPSSTPAWFASYDAMIEHYAALAREGGAETLVIGDELTSMSSDTPDFASLIASVRNIFAGRLTFGANWVQGAERVGFWRLLDYVGVDAYMPLTAAGTRPSVERLVAAWQPWIQRLRRLHAQSGRPVIFTELGYASQPDATADPAGARAAATTHVDQVVQANAYAAAYRALSPLDWFDGIYWWDWSADGHNTSVSDGSYRPAGKLAEHVISYWNGVSRRLPTGLR